MQMKPNLQILATFGILSGAIATAYAQSEPPPVAVFEKVVVEAKGGAIFARRGAVTARIAVGTFVNAPVVDAKAKKITFATADWCDRNLGTVSLSFDQLSSRLDNVIAFGLHKKKKYAESKAGFAKALALDPSNRVAAVNLASAQQLLGEKAEAIKTLTPWLASEPVSMYLTVATDPELAPLLASPELVALKAKTSGNVTVSKKGLKGGAAYSSERGLLAVERRECSWGRDGEDSCELLIEFFDASGKLTTAQHLIDFDDSNRALVQRRVKAAQQSLRDLGFKTEAVVRGKDTRTDKDREDLKGKMSFPTLKLGVVTLDGKISVFRGDTAVAQGAGFERLQDAAWAPSVRSFIISSLSSGREGCEGTDPTQTTILPVTTP